MLPPSSALSDFLNFLATVVSAIVDSGAPQAGRAPGIRVGQILRPERPGPALVRPDRVNRTAPLAVHLPQEDAVLRGPVLDDRSTHPHPPQVPAPKLARRHIQVLGDQLNLRLDHPDVPLHRPGATPAALPARKVQPPRIPSCPNRLVSHSNLITSNDPPV